MIVQALVGARPEKKKNQHQKAPRHTATAQKSIQLEFLLLITMLSEQTELSFITQGFIYQPQNTVGDSLP